MVKFTSTKLNAQGKKGILEPDSDGYYTLVIGALNSFNSVGEYYTLDGAKKLFEKSSVLMRRIANGCLKGEVGHPKKLPNMTNDAYLRRIMTIEETNVCCHFKEVWLDESYGKNNPALNNPNLVAIMAKVKPSGPKGPALKEALDNPHENVCFSVRAFTMDYMHRGVNQRVLDQVMCWDYVTEPGLAIATKWNSPALEELSAAPVTKEIIDRLLQNVQSSIAIEDSKEMLQHLAESIKNPIVKPTYTQW